MRTLLPFWLCFLLLPPAVPAQPVDGAWRPVLDLGGPWLFRIGDDPAWSALRLNDKDWDAVRVPSSWEDAAYPGYDGYAWYRRHFYLDADAKGRPLYVHLGRIDDADAVYVNGQLVGASGAFPPNFRTAHHEHRSYRIPPDVLRPGRENVIAVRVFDARLAGGIVDGPVGLFERRDLAPLAVDLAGTWRFRPGDDPQWKEAALHEAGWRPIQVPARWEPQGYADLDGFAWYRVHFTVPPRLQGEDFVLLLGRIDDLDEAFLNGIRIGRTGDLERRRIEGDEWRRVRVYKVPAQAIRFGQDNTLAVRVYDGLLDGGIYEGPVGLTTRAAFERWEKAESNPLIRWLRDLFE